jgi:hypothetical protein
MKEISEQSVLRSMHGTGLKELMESSKMQVVSAPVGTKTEKV